MIRVLIADSHSARRDRTRADLASDPEIEIVGLARDGQEAQQLAHVLTPHIALLSAELAVQDGFLTAELLTAGGVPTQSILVSDQDAPDELRRAMRAGARELLARPFTRSVLLQTVRRVHEEAQRRRSPAFLQAADPDHLTRVVAVGGAKGGIGKTTLATNLAVALAVETGQPTALLDLYPQFGDVALLLNLTPRRTLVDLAALDVAEIDAPLLEDCLERHPTGLRVLLGAATPVALDAITVGCLEHILSLLKRDFRYIVLDVPPVLHATTLYALSHASTVLLLANLFDLTTIHDTRQLCEAIEGKYVAREKIMIALNRVSRHNRLQIPDIERALGHPIAARIPNDGKIVPTSVNQGVPFMISHPESAVADSVRHLACGLASPAASHPPGQEENKRFWSKWKRP